MFLPLTGMMLILPLPLVGLGFGIPFTGFLPPPFLITLEAAGFLPPGFLPPGFLGAGFLTGLGAAGFFAAGFLVGFLLADCFLLA